MSKADKLLCLFEGFKLGDLGAGRKLSKTELSVVPKRHTIKIERFGKFGKSYVWKENFDPDWISVFPESALNKIKDMSSLEGTIASITYYMQKKEIVHTSGPLKSRKSYPKYFEYLSIHLKGPSGEATDTIIFWLNGFGIDDYQTALKYLEKRANQASQKGLEALNFPRLWEVVP